MQVTIKNEDDGDITLIQNEPNFQGKPISKKTVLLESRLVKIGSVLNKAITDNPVTLVVEFELTLPSTANRQKRSTMNNSKMLKLFFKYLEPEIESEVESWEGYTPNKLRFLARKKHQPEYPSYYSYKVAILVNQAVFPDISTCIVGGRSLTEKVITSWSLATDLEYGKIKREFSGQGFDNMEVNGFASQEVKGYERAHYNLSIFALVGGGRYLHNDDAFYCSID